VRFSHVAILAQTAAAWYSAGFIWTMQILNYPLLDRIDAASVGGYETAHNQRFAAIVAPGAILAVVSSIALLTSRPRELSLAAPIATAILIVVVIAATVLWQFAESLRPTRCVGGVTFRVLSPSMIYMKRAIVVACLLAFTTAAFADDDEPLYTCKAATGKLHAVFNPETELKDLVTWLMGFTCKNVIVGAGVDVGTKVTIRAPNAMTSKQAVKLFFDSVDAAGYVVLDKGDSIVIKPGPGSPKPCSGAPATVVAPKTATVTPPADEREVALYVRKIDDTHYEITEKTVDAVLANPMTVSKGARVVPAVKDGKPDGFKVYAIRPSSFYARIGLENGDTLQRINGYDISSADNALETYAKLRHGKAFELDITRRGKPMALTITIKN
jgi:hypothetical protein